MNFYKKIGKNGFINFLTNNGHYIIFQNCIIGRIHSNKYVIFSENLSCTNTILYL